MQKLTESRRLRTTIVALLWLFMVGSAFLMYWAWNTDSYPLRVAVGFAFFAEFSLIATFSALVGRFVANRQVSAALVLSSLFLWEVVPAGLLLLWLTFFYPIGAVPILVTIFLAIWARYLIGRDAMLPGLLIFCLPLALIIAFCFYRPWSASSAIWPVVGTIHSVLLLAVLCLFMFQIGHVRGGRYPEAQKHRIAKV